MTEVKISDLKLVRYNIIESSFITVKNNDDSITKIKQGLNTRPYNIDLTVLESKNKESFLLKIEVNNYSEKKLSGYDFNISLLTSFELDGIEKMDKEIITQYILYSAFPMALNIARTHISNNTSNGFFGRYILPAINLPEFIEKWIKEKENNRDVS
ncbi:MAG: hypothetical protein JXR68_12050 [Bacteroidales bacterium]|nr:hypothetical protein [Bacteroidales bacterium]